MARAKLNIILDKLSGRFAGKSEFYTTHRYGKTVVSNYPLHKDPKSITANQRANSASFGEASKQCKVEMSNPDRLAYWQDLYNQYCKLANRNLSKANTQFFGVPSDKYYSTLRGFIIAQLRTQSTT